MRNPIRRYVIRPPFARSYVLAKPVITTARFKGRFESFLVKSIVLFCGTAFGFSCQAVMPDITTENVKSESAPIDDRYQGTVLNQTVSRFGQTFYHLFVLSWRDNILNERYSIVIKEKVTPRHGSQIFIDYQSRRVYQTYLPPAISSIRSLSENAVNQVYEKIMDVDVQRLLMLEPDLARDEI